MRFDGAVPKLGAKKMLSGFLVTADATVASMVLTRDVKASMIRWVVFAFW